MNLDLAFILDQQFALALEKRQGDLTSRVKEMNKVKNILKNTNNSNLRYQIKVKEVQMFQNADLPHQESQTPSCATEKIIVEPSEIYKASPYKKVFRTARGSLESVQFEEIKKKIISQHQTNTFEKSQFQDSKPIKTKQEQLFHELILIQESNNSTPSPIKRHQMSKDININGQSMIKARTEVIPNPNHEFKSTFAIHLPQIVDQSNRQDTTESSTAKEYNFKRRSSSVLRNSHTYQKPIRIPYQQNPMKELKILPPQQSISGDKVDISIKLSSMGTYADDRGKISSSRLLEKTPESKYFKFDYDGTESPEQNTLQKRLELIDRDLFHVYDSYRVRGEGFIPTTETEIQFFKKSLNKIPLKHMRYDEPLEVKTQISQQQPLRLSLQKIFKTSQIKDSYRKFESKIVSARPDYQKKDIDDRIFKVTRLDFSNSIEKIIREEKSFINSNTNVQSNNSNIKLLKQMTLKQQKKKLKNIQLYNDQKKSRLGQSSGKNFNQLPKVLSISRSLPAIQITARNQEA